VRQKASSSRASSLPTAPGSWPRHAAGSSSAAPSKPGRSRAPSRGARLNSAARDYVDAVAERLREHLGTGLVGLYLHGSAALGDYHPTRSDIDLLGVCTAPISERERVDIAARLSRDALPCPAGGGLEFSLITWLAARDPGPAPGYELHGWDEAGRLHADLGQGDPDLPLHFAVVRACGVAVLGPPPSEVFRTVPRSELLPRLSAELDWADANASPSYRVLAACRAWRLLDDDRICSKRAAAEWALDHGAPRDLVATVLDHHIAATAPADVDPAAVCDLVAAVRARLAAAAE
jgi:hypothetical protein